MRIAESTWSTCEPQDGVFDFSHVERVMDAMEEAGINVIIGTPTYAVPAWMVKAHPDVIATTKKAQGSMVQDRSWTLPIRYIFLCGACDPQADGDQCPQEMCYRFPGG